MGLKHGKYIYVKRSDGWYVKVRVLNVRFGKKQGEGVDASNPTRYIVTGSKTRIPPVHAVVVEEEAIPQPVRSSLYEV
ncbi:DUF5622 domain-containing protein [Desulfurococcus mucosus]|uniref:DUF5622 domain-containing protein n=1 Tax=Desulfurococcus mucosus (strain ATCC 35584 / DSM 2162 / JCM 9187 / O7/1) TaxID=765177 RepID=E8R8Z9_DESM0|nr:DUF5622 domain-containing protein [Desulfurococcus mucosus]ADV64975.1 hypothetical protein Desmu_0667 [Desulfurococcus mucosus DSM 2162]